MQAGVQVEGLAELRRALRRIDPVLTDGLRAGLKDAGKIVADEGERRAPRSHQARGRHMADTIRVRVSGVKVRVVVNAKRRSPAYPAGFNYPGRIEFEGGGRRAFLQPALEAKHDQVVERLGQVLDDVADTFDQGG